MWPLIIAGIAIILLIVILQSRHRFTTPTVGVTKVSATPDTYAPPKTWSTNDTGICNIYTAKGTSSRPGSIRYQTLSNPGVAVPMTLTRQLCVDEDQLQAMQITHKCESTGGCRKQNGDLASNGFSESVYVPCDRSAPPDHCGGTAGLIAFNFNNSNRALSSMKCLLRAFDGSATIGACSYEFPDQQTWRVQRYSLNSDGSLVEAPTGNFAKIMDRVYNKYLDVDVNSNNKLITAKADSSRNGVNWILVPPIAYFGGPAATIAQQQIVWRPPGLDLQAASASQTTMWNALTGLKSIQADNGTVAMMRPFISGLYGTPTLQMTNGSNAAVISAGLFNAFQSNDIMTLTF